MFRLEKTFRFESAHYLPHHEGKCRRMHGHSWECTLAVEGSALQEEGPQQGMLMDFDVLGILCQRLHAALDHTLLNEFIANPTSESLALWIHAQVVYNPLHFPALPEGVRLAEIRIAETCTCRCVYRPPE